MTTIALICLGPLVGLLAGAETTPTCTSVSCHESLVKKAHVHDAVTSGDCTDCHTAVAPEGDAKAKCGSGNNWELANAQPDLCFSCHDVKKATPLHPAIDDGCTVCHSPHASDNAHLLVTGDVTVLCGNCHEQGNEPNLHAAIGANGCTGCHDPHSGVEAPLLVGPRADLCTGCHDLDGDVLGGLEHKHAPVVARDCTGCHNPHGSANRPLLKAPSAELCLRCHASQNAGKPGVARIAIEVAQADVHGALTLGGCGDCHRAHASRFQRLLRKPQPVLCYDCHARQDTTPFVHSALRLGQCSGCHDPHAAPRAKLLRGKSNNELCFVCHSDDLTGRAFVHSPARNDCLSCHHPHGAAQAPDLRDAGKALCYRCHPVMDDVKYPHAVLATSGCIACHDPHGTANRAYLIKPINELCTSCHPAQADGKHVPGMSRPEGHKVTGGVDPKRPGRSFSCVSCHNPHGSNFAKLSRAGGGSMALCAYCHFNDTAARGAARPTPAEVAPAVVDEVKPSAPASTEPTSEEAP